MVIYDRTKKTLTIPKGLGCSGTYEQGYTDGYEVGYAKGKAEVQK